MTEPPDRNNGNLASVAAVAEAVLHVENAPLALIVCWPDGHVSMANRAMRALLGYGDGEIVRCQVWELCADPDHGQRCFRQLLSDGEAPERLMVLRRRDGQTVPTYGSAVVTKGEGGTVSLVIGQARPA